MDDLCTHLSIIDSKVKSPLHFAFNHVQPITSRHTVVCRAAQEAGAQPREYIDRKKENAIFAPP